MTATTEHTAAALNGTPPLAGDPAAAPAEEAVSFGERAMGVIGIAFAIGLLAIGIDLATGGALSRALNRAAETMEQDNAGTGG